MGRPATLMAHRIGELFRICGPVVAFAVLAACGGGGGGSVSSGGGGSPAPTPGAPCGQGSAYPDGCGGAQTHGVFRIADLYVYAAQSGQAWSSHHPPPWNLAGVDYPVGYDNSRTLLDPQTNAASLPAGCAYEASGSQNGGPEVLCDKVGTTAAVSPTFDGWDFSGKSGAGACVWLHFTTRVTGTITVTNSRFQDNGACDVANGSLINVESGVSANFVFKYNEVDGNFSGVANAELSALVLSQGSATTPSTVTIAYNDFINLSSIPITGTQTNATVLDAFNLYSGYTLNAANGLHGTLYEIINPDGGAGTSITHSYNTVVLPSTTPVNEITTAFSFLSHHSPGEQGVSYALIQVDHNVVVANSNGGVATTSSALSYISYLKSVTTVVEIDNYVDPTGAAHCVENLGGGYQIAGKIDNGFGAAGNVLTVTSVADGAIWAGATFAGSGVTSEVIQPFGATCDGLTSTGSGGAGTYCLGAGVTAQGPISSGGGTTWQTENTPMGSVTFSGNVNMRDGSAITNDGVQWTTGQCNGHA